MRWYHAYGVHKTTVYYDRLLVQLWDRRDARGEIREVADDVLRRWAEPIL